MRHEGSLTWKAIVRKLFFIVVNSDNNGDYVNPLYHCGASAETQSRENIISTSLPILKSLMWTVSVSMG